MSSTDNKRDDWLAVFIASVAFICVYIFVYAVWNTAGQPFVPAYLSRIIEAGGIILAVFVLRKTSLTPPELGLSTENPGSGLKGTATICLAIIAFMCVFKLLAMQFLPGLIAHPEAFFDPAWFEPITLLYFFVVFIQEFLARGLIQESLLHLVDGRRGELISILISTLIFVALHVGYGPLMMFGAGILMGVFGIIYVRQRSIWSVSLIHFVFGFSALLLGLF